MSQNNLFCKYEGHIYSRRLHGLQSRCWLWCFRDKTKPKKSYGKVYKGCLLFSFKIHKLNYNAYNQGIWNLHILLNLCEWVSALHFKLTPVSLLLCLLLYFCRLKPKKPTSLPTYLNAYRQSSDTKASSACVYRAAAATLDPESQWAHSASDAHLFQGSQRATKQQTLIPM